MARGILPSTTRSHWCCRSSLDHEGSIHGELQKLPVWVYAGKADTRAVSWRDLWWLADRHGLEMTASETTISTGGGVEATVYT